MPEIADDYIALIEAQHAQLPFSPEVREAVILTIGAAWNTPFEIYAHRAVARMVGLAPDTIEILAKGGEPEGLSREAMLARRSSARPGLSR